MTIAPLFLYVSEKGSRRTLYSAVHAGDKTIGAFDLRLRPAAGAVAPLRPWVGDGAKFRVNRIGPG